MPKPIFYQQSIFNLAGKLYLKALYNLIFLSIGFGQLKTDADILINELGCGSCHAGIKPSNLISSRAPDLSRSGTKYNPAYIFDYLKSPHKVRYNIGASRMPNFNLSDDEALALTKFLDSKKIDQPIAIPATTNNDLNAFQLISDEYQCTACHIINKQGQQKSIDLNTSGARLKREWVYETILNPQQHLSQETAMPMFFDKNDYRSIEIIVAMTNHIIDNGKSELKGLNKKYKKALQSFPKTTIEQGRNIFLSQNCISCHEMQDENSWFTKHNAPDLSAQKLRTKSPWLISYLQSPTPIRPNGFYPGTGSRMPDYNLKKDEINTIMSWFNDFVLNTTLKPLSNFQIQKAENLLENNLSCLGCHQLNGKGGMIGPDLTNTSNRLTDGYIKMAIESPHMVMPESIMPKQNIDKKTMKLIQSYLSMDRKPSQPEYINLTSKSINKITSSYSANCSSCHGITGDGNGYNAAYLPTTPGNFTDSTLFSTRSDDAIYETIYNGGKIMKKHHYMPSWGLKLSHSEIVQYISQIRRFCDCKPPKWAEK